jgi:hypothetical protein
VKTAILIATILLVGTAVDASAQLLRSEFCAAKFTATSAELSGGFRTYAILLPGNRFMSEKMTRTEWTSCVCSRGDQSCDCCSYDIAKACAEVKRLEVVNNSVIRLRPCEGGQR